MRAPNLSPQLTERQADMAFPCGKLAGEANRAPQRASRRTSDEQVRGFLTPSASPRSRTSRSQPTAASQQMIYNILGQA